MPTRVILDTDIGTDVDDCLALALILASPEIQLEGVTCVYGDVELRARMVLKLLRLRGRTDVPVYTGARLPLLGRRSIYWGGHEGHGLLEPEDEGLVASPDHAVSPPGLDSPPRSTRRGNRDSAGLDRLRVTPGGR